MTENGRGWRNTERVNGGGDAAGNGQEGIALRVGQTRRRWGFAHRVLGVRTEEGKGDRGTMMSCGPFLGGGG
jgi:hypothetical protein